MPFGRGILKTGIHENWLFKFANRQGTYLYLAFADTHDVPDTWENNNADFDAETGIWEEVQVTDEVSTVFYHGAILNKPTIRESINLSKSTAKTSNMNVVISDFSYNGSPVSKELFGGTNNYINQIVTIHSIINDDLPNQIGSFRLVDISTDGTRITLSLASHRPWDYLAYEERTTGVTKVIEPIFYGNFTGNTKTGFLFTDLTNYNLRPIPRVPGGGGFSNGSVAISSYTYLPELWDKEAGKFIPISEGTTGNTTSTQGTNMIYAASLYKREIIFRGDQTSGSWSDLGNVIDTNTSSYAYKSWSASGAATSEFIVYFPEELVGEAVGNGTLKFTWENSCSATSGPVGNMIKLYYGVNTTSAGSMNTLVSELVATNSASGEVTGVSVSNPLGGYIGFKSEAYVTGGQVSGYSRIKDVQLTVTLKNGFEGNFVYSGEDGFTHSITDTNYNGNAISTIHEAHLDVLARFCGVDSSDVASDVYGWDDGTSSDLASDRSGWNIRWWSLEKTFIQDILEQMQYEGCFIFRFKQGDFTKPQYIHLKDSPSADVTLSKNDIANFNLSITPFSEIITKRIIKYGRHPVGEDKYLNETTISVTSGTTPRTTWNIQTKENIEQISLDMLVDKVTDDDGDGNLANDDRNDSFASYYNKIFGDVKLVLSCDIINPSKWVDGSDEAIEVGNYITFDHTNMFPETPMGYNSATWLGLIFVITSTQRSIGKLSIQARAF